LSAAFTGESGLSIGAAQRQLGRAYRPKVRTPTAPIDEDLDEGLFGGDFDIGKKKSPKPGKKPERTKAEKEKLNRFLKATGAKEIDERKLSKGEEKEKEKIVKGMKKSKSDFKKRYGDDAESVMYATATKIAKDKK